ncbi:hypothetical protein DCC39_08475 [Pueribacillus theae]|uniref:C4-dicarboxylate ABC transporter substrate-binding protein n=1 Tax=Pueribacillus theae TaxID=2171751 RepID=A0A2U1K492_9BACI|nr:TRAP transporter substrate-binding protein DctP [Pueribacillus theae]PWA11959.1 hypothetical protein DCC39_08475 [Pueribacillus theae]
MNFKKAYLNLIILLVGTLLVGCGGKSASSNENESKKEQENDSVKAIELNVNNFAPSTGHLAYNVFEPWKEIVEEKTNDRVKVNLYHGASLGKANTVYQDVEGGLYEVGLVATNYFYDTKFFPYTIGNLPFALVEEPEKSKAVLKKFGEKYANEDLSDVILMPPTITDPYIMFSSKPIKSVNDLKKKKMRASSTSEAEFVKALDGVPVSITYEDTYEALQKNTVETSFFSPIAAIGPKFFEPAPYISKLNISVIPFVPIMNKTFYDNLPEDLKKIFDEELNPKLTELVTESYKLELEKSYEKLKDEVANRGEIITPTEEEVKIFKEAGKAAWDNWIETADKKGYNGQEMVDEFIKLLEEEGLQTPF